MYTIGITGVGGGVGQSIIKSLQNTDYRLIGTNGDVLGAGLFSVHRSYIVPYASQDDYIEKLLSVCKENDIKLLFPGMDAELYKLSGNKDLFASVGTTVVVSDLDVINIAEDKWNTYFRLRALGFNVPETYKLEDLDGKIPLPFPFIIKPYIGGARSKDVFLVKDIEAYNLVLAGIEGRQNNFIMQEYLAGDEYTCGTVTLDEECIGAIVMKRELRGGDTYKSHTVKHPVIEQFLVKLMSELKPFGACNVQLKLKNGEPCAFEINARCSGTTAQRTLCGFNEPKMIADYLLYGTEPSYTIHEKTILRYWNELEVDNTALADLSANGFADINELVSL